ncbi:MAG: lipid-A-disaccharide synthase N-terminal domain-containing protein [Candidatus Omnitrophota bacterium]
MNFWIGLGLFAQLLFFLRFFVQWIASEKKGESTIPVSFWYLSIAGSILLLIYSLYRKDIVFILGQTTGSFIYLRNLALIYRKNNPIV